jgi:hypothetical protein
MWHHVHMTDCDPLVGFGIMDGEGGGGGGADHGRLRTAIFTIWKALLLLPTSILQV